MGRALTRAIRDPMIVPRNEDESKAIMDKYMGTQFGLWKVVGIKDKYHREARLLCECECGLLTGISITRLLWKETTGCYRCVTRTNAKWRKHIGKNNIANQMKLIGQNFGAIVVETFIGYSVITREPLFATVCSNCSRRYDLPRKRLMDRRNRGQTYCKSCAPAKRAKQEALLSKSFLNRLRRTADRRGLEWDVSADHLSELYVSQNGRCALSGLPIDLPRTIGHYIENGVSLDRIDSKKGYVVGNVQWLRKDVNIMKMHYSQDHFIRICTLIAQNHRMTIAV